MKPRHLKEFVVCIIQWSFSRGKFIMWVLEVKLIHVTEIIPRDTLVTRDNVVFINMLTINSDLDLRLLWMHHLIPYNMVHVDNFIFWHHPVLLPLYFTMRIIVTDNRFKFWTEIEDFRRRFETENYYDKYLVS